MELIVLIAILIAYNIIINKFLAPKWHLLFSLSLSIFVIWWVVRSSDISLGEIGAAFSSLLNGFIYGALAVVVIALVIAASIFIPVTRGLFHDERIVGLNTRQLLYKTLVNIPIGTVFLEEVIFRGVMLTLLMQEYSTVVAVLISSILFGLWHILPSVTNISTNKSVKRLKKPGLSVIAGTVFITFLAGIAFSWLRLSSGSLLAPMMAHYALNSGGVIASWWLTRFKK